MAHLDEHVLRHFEVQRRGALADAPRRVIVRAVARAEEALRALVRESWTERIVDAAQKQT